jgi:hypothetical protein
VRKPDDQKAIKNAPRMDFADYGANPEVDYLIALIYDPSHQLPAAGTVLIPASMTQRRAPRALRRRDQRGNTERVVAH